MAAIIVETIEVKSASVSGGALDALRDSLRGGLGLTGETGYDEARTVWNAAIDRRSAAIVHASCAGDVLQPVRRAARHRLLQSVEGGGHDIAGSRLRSDVLALDPLDRWPPSTRAQRATVPYNEIPSMNT